MFGHHIIIGLGNPYRGDDGIGIACIDKIRISHPDIVTYTEIHDEIDEIILDIIKQNNFKKILFIDAADFNEQPGSYRLIKEVNSFYPTVSTHEVSMKFFFELLEKNSIECSLLAIQPAELGFEEGLSVPMQNFLNSELENQIEKFIKIS